MRKQIIMNNEEKPDLNQFDESNADGKDAAEQHDEPNQNQVDEQSAEVIDSDDLSELETAQAEAAKFKDAFLRAKAEQDNIRRRAEKDVANGRKFAVEAFAKEMAAVYDSLKLACAVELSDDVDESVKRVHEGVEITLKQLQSAFAKNALKEIAPQTGTKLDPNLHQAMTMIESQDVESGCIVNVIQAGFELHDRLLRPAMVVVAK